MTRKARIIDSAGIYHVTHRGNNRETTFLDVSDYHRYLDLLALAQKKYPFDLFHYVLMPNHVHLVLRSRTERTISPALQWIAQNYAKSFNAAYGKSGHLWGDRFFSKVIDTDTYLLTAGIYIELNPVRAGICSDPGAYAWSSHAYYANGKPNALLKSSPTFTGLHQDVSVRRSTYATITKMWGVING